ncbi:MAG: hypothetical protein ACLPUO_11365 [Streptosporangiaceae bacterium]
MAGRIRDEGVPANPGAGCRDIAVAGSGRRAVRGRRAPGGTEAGHTASHQGDTVTDHVPAIRLRPVRHRHVPGPFILPDAEGPQVS